MNIAIAGAGPAGLAAALALLKSGHRVTLFDQFDAPRPLGSGLLLQPTGMAVLDWLGLGTRMRTLGQPIDRLYGRATSTGRIVLDVRYEALRDCNGLAVHRAALFNVLHDAVRAADIPIHTASRIVDRIENRLLLADGRRSETFDLVVDALGSRSPLIRQAAESDRRRRLDYGAIWASLPWPGAPFLDNALEQRYDRASVMIGVLPIGRRFENDTPQTAFFWSLKTAEHSAWLSRGLTDWKTRVQSLWPETESLLKAITSPEQMVLAGYEHHTLPVPYGDRLVFVGDSAHSTSPQLGQGANMALLDAHALTMAINRNEHLGKALHDYARMRRFHVRLYQAMSLMFTPFYQSDSRVLPLIRDTLVPLISHIPPVPQLLAILVSGQLGHRFHQSLKCKGNPRQATPQT